MTSTSSARQSSSPLCGRVAGGAVPRGMMVGGLAFCCAPSLVDAARTLDTRRRDLFPTLLARPRRGSSRRQHQPGTHGRCRLAWLHAPCPLQSIGGSSAPRHRSAELRPPPDRVRVAPVKLFSVAPNRTSDSTARRSCWRRLGIRSASTSCPHRTPDPSTRRQGRPEGAFLCSDCRGRVRALPRRFGRVLCVW